MLSWVGCRVGGLLVRVPNHMLIPRAGMAGHSKWSTIKRQKGAEDMKRFVDPMTRPIWCDAFMWLPAVALHTGIHQFEINGE